MKKIKSTIKRGPISQEEKKKIELWIETKTDKEIGLLLRRQPEVIQMHRVAIMANAPHVVENRKKGVGIKENLRAHPQWKHFKEQFTREEMILFESSYVELVGQFDANILPTEQKQIFQAITLEIFINRHNKERHDNQKDIERLKKMQEDIYNIPQEQRSNADKELLTGIINQIQAMQATSQSKTKEYKDLSDKYSNILKELKGTREQRIQKIENSGQKFTGLLRQLDEEDFRKRTGVTMNLMDAAADQERRRLSEYHTYMDGEVDKPLLRPEDM